MSRRYYEQPFPDDRELPIECIDPESLFDDPAITSLYDAAEAIDLDIQPQPRKAMAEDDFTKKLKRFDVLTDEEERDYVELIHKSRTAEEQLKTKDLSDDERQALEAQVRNGQAARQEFYLTNLRLGAWVARMTMNLPGQSPRASSSAAERIYRGAIFANLASFAGAPLPLADRIQEANIKISDAIDKYEPGSAAKFNTFAMYHIEAGIARAIQDYGVGTGLRFPAAVADTIRKIRRSIDFLSSQIHTDVVSDEDVVRDTGLSFPVVQHLRALDRMHDALSWESESNRQISRNADTSPDDESVTLQDTIADPDESVEDQIMEDTLTDVMRSLLSGLSAREAGVIRLRYGLTDGDPRTLDEIGRIYGVTRTRISQIEKKTLKVLRHPNHSRLLRAYYDDSYDGWEEREAELKQSAAEARQQEVEEAAKESLRRHQRQEAARSAEGPKLTGYQRHIMRESRRLFEFEYGPYRPGGHRSEEAERIDPVLLETQQAFLENVDVFRHTGTYAPFPDIARMADRINKMLPESATAAHLTEVWNGELEKIIESVGGQEQLDDAVFNMVFTELLNARMTDVTEITLTIPESMDGVLDRFASGLRKGVVVAKGNLGNRAGENMSGEATLIVHGSVKNMVGTNSHDKATIVVYGNAQSNAGLAMRDESTLIIHGRAGRFLGREAAPTVWIETGK